jgi:hypothetical protein
VIGLLLWEEFGEERSELRRLTQRLTPFLNRLSKVRDPEEYKKLESLFQIQRETSQARIEILRLKHSEVLSTKVKKLVKYKKTAR